MSERDPRSAGVAVLGMSLRMPGASSPETLWRNLERGVDSIRRLDDAALERAGVSASEREHPAYVPVRGTIEDVDLFDAELFGMSPRQAVATDPQHRLFLECAWEAMERAGRGERPKGPVAVFASSGFPSYLLEVLGPARRAAGRDGLQLSDFEVFVGNDKDFLPTRTSYVLDLRGPSVSVNTACSGSLTAVHLACQSLLTHQADLAIAGGVSIRLPQERGYSFQRDGIHSPDGRVRPFDAEARGMVDGNGVGVVVLARLGDALAAGDPILAVIRGSAINNDGAAKVGYTAPGIDGQASVIAEALAVANVEPREVSYLEAHGTGTALGDPVEVTALHRVFGFGAVDGRRCVLGSVKGNLGHLDTAAGVAGLIKTVLALQHRKVPPTMHFSRPNPGLELAKGPFEVSAELRDWPSPAGRPRLAGVSAFGIGGSNAHVVVEEAPPLAESPSPPSRRWQVLPVSARTPTAVATACLHLAEHLESDASSSSRQPLADVAYTLRAGRRHFPSRRAVVAGTADEAARALRQAAVAEEPTVSGGVAFLLPGQGAQWTGMASGLYRDEPVFRRAVDRCAEALECRLGLDLTSLLFGVGGRVGDEDSLRRTELAQPAIFTVSWAMARLWRSFGIRPSALLGHSLGEITAACLADVFDLEDALSFVAGRGAAMAAQPTGRMVAIDLEGGATSCERALEPLRRRWGLEADPVLDALDLAAVNAPGRVVMGGEASDVETLVARLHAARIPCRVLPTSHAFHSRSMDGALASLEELLGEMELRPPQVPVVSTLSGGWLTAAEATDPRYWIRQARQPVRFAEGLETLLGIESSDAAETERGRDARRPEPPGIVLEVGPGHALSSMARAVGGGRREPWSALASLPCPRRGQRARSDRRRFLDTVATIWRHGVEVDWGGLGETDRRRVALPTYPFERVRHWPEVDRSEDPERRPREDPRTTTPRPGELGERSVPLERRTEVEDWFYVPSWRRLGRAPRNVRFDGQRILVLAGNAVGSGLASALELRGADVRVLGPPGASSASTLYAWLEEALHGDPAWRPHHVVHLWSLLAGAERSLSERLDGLDRCVDLAFHAPLAVARALGGRGQATVRLTLITDRLLEIDGDRVHQPERGVALGAVRTLPVEYPELRCTLIDVDVQSSSLESLELHPLDPLLDVIGTPGAAGAGGGPGAGDDASSRVLALRGESVWEQAWVRRRPAASTPRTAWPVRADAPVLITGGTGGIGLHLAESLADRAAASADGGRARLALLGRSPLPSVDAWADAWRDEPAGSRRGRLAALARRADVLYLRADVSDRSQVHEVLNGTRRHFGTTFGAAIHCAGVGDYAGVVHRRGREESEAVLAPKVRGSLVLADLLRDDGLELFVLSSSLGTVLRHQKYGQVAYASANAVLDLLPESELAGLGRVLTISWDDWRQVGMTVDAEAIWRRRHGGGDDFHFLTDGTLEPAEGVEVFHRAVADPQPHWLISTRDLDSLVRLDRAFASSYGARTDGVARPDLDRPANVGAPVARLEATALESLVVELWERTLGRPIDTLDDDFYDLGGDSLTGLQLAAAVEERLRVSLGVADLLEARSVREFAAMLRGRLSDDVLAALDRPEPDWAATETLDPESLDPERLLKRIDRLSDAQVSKLLGHRFSWEDL